MTQQLISILVPIYNAEAFLPGLIASVVGQTYTNWELVCVDDGSTDGSRQILESISKRDQRIRLTLNDRNLGPSATLNRAASLAESELLFRLDADDTMVSKRIEKQVAYLARHPNVGLLGSAYVNVDEQGERSSKVTSSTLSGPGLKAKFLFSNAMGHSTVVYRKSVFQQIGGYDEKLRASLDYDLLARLSMATDCALLPDVLVNYLTHTENISTTKRALQRSNAAAVQALLLDTYGFSATAAQLELHADISFGKPENGTSKEYAAFIAEARNWLADLRRQNRERKVFPEPAFARVLAEVHTRLFARAASPLKLRDYLRGFTTDFDALLPANFVSQLAHSLKRGI